MLRIQDLVFDAWGRRFFDNASVVIPEGWKVGLVGRNGAGKSTLFRLILGDLTHGGGDILMPKGARIGTVAQEHEATDVTILDTVLEADERRHNLMVELETAAPERLGDIYAALAHIDADRAPSRAAEILAGLGFANDDLYRPMSEFSGGWRMRVAMAAALFAEPDVLLLDEPTNYLDLEGALWLEAKLKKYPHTCIVISHDRELLNNSVDCIVHLADQKLDIYTGGYDSFEAQRAEKMRLQSASRAKIEAQRAHMQSFVDRFRAKASKAAQAQSRLKMIAKLPVVAATVEEHVAPFRIPSAERPLAPPLIRLEGVNVGYGGEPILKHMNLRMDPDDRIGLLGVNGAGKSTFAKLLAGALKADRGAMHRSARTTVAWFHQHQIEALDPEDTPLQIMSRAMPLSTEPQCRARLAGFGMTVDKVHTKVGSLSGGERARLLLNMVAMDKPHLLILDEPTNHLDIDSRRALLDALNDYEGAVLLITHDRSLMELVADRLWLCADGTIKPFDGDMADYAKYVLDRARRASREAKPKAENAALQAASSDLAPAASAPKLNEAQAAPLKRKVEAAEQVMARETKILAEIDADLADTSLYVKDPAKVRSLTDQRAKIAQRLAAAEAKWMEAAEAYEGAVGSR